MSTGVRHVSPLRPVREIAHRWIPLADGCRLAARIWLPEGAEDDPVPAILEYIPYRKNDATAMRDAAMHPYFAGHGYAAVRVDIRGSGDSDGILLGEYLLQEQDDALEVLAWLAAQPWCSGEVGIIGKSWGGFNGLQVAARRPPELRAIVTVCSTDDRYADDVHYMGGCVLASDMLAWASTMLAFNARPPDPDVVGESWRDTWLERLAQTPPFVEEWLAHQRRDAFWKHGSVCEDYGAIDCPVYAVGGWADGYSNAVLRLLEGLECPRKGLIGPWAHLYPHDGAPGPAIGFLQECLRWWDHWLKGVDTGVMDEPMLRVWMQDPVPPLPRYDHRPGRWVAEPSWPRRDVEEWVYTLGDGRLEEGPAERKALAIRGAQETGLDAGAWTVWDEHGGLPLDQQEEDGRSLCFDSEPLAEPLELLGFPRATLTLSSDQPLALLAVRLCDVAPDGASLLVTRGLLNLTHRDSHEEPEPLDPGHPYEIEIALNAIAQRIPAGHRIRLALSPTYWPHAWPSPRPVTLTVSTGDSRLWLPGRPPRSDDDSLRPFDPPETAPLPAVDVSEASTPGRIRREPAPGVHELIVDQSFFGERRFLATGLRYSERGSDTFTIAEDDPLSARASSDWTIEIGRGDWQTRVEASSVMSADERSFQVSSLVVAYEGEVRVFSRTWTAVVPRDLV